jgi:hypothetical protein
VNIDREIVWYESLYVKLCWFKCIAMICGKVQVFVFIYFYQVARLPEIEYTMTKSYQHSATICSMIGC